MLEDLVQEWDGEEVVMAFDAPAKTWMFVCVHSTVLGPAGGGTRMKVYPTPADGLADGLRLAGAMTRKNAMAELPLGGGKAVLAAIHDLTLAAQFCHRLVMLHEGRVVAEGDPWDVLAPERLRAVYGARVRVFPHPLNGRPVVVPDRGDAGDS